MTVSESVLQVFANEQRGLAAAGAPAAVASPGGLVPDVSLVDASGNPITLSKVLDGRTAVLVLYRGAWCPHCNLALRTYQADLLPAIVGRGIALVALSPQLPDGSLTMAEKNALSFEVLSDPGNQLARHFGVLTAPSSEARATQLELGLDLAKINADATVGLPMPTVAILDTQRVLRWIDVQPDYSHRTAVSDVLAALDATT